ncbi:ROK family transcriptional regulator [Micromonospora zamorensis]|uniref:ROK family transcriptional regulator n=1 Tax=Micromonospora zamorensis TaxID=709883 RepID=UPI0033F0F3BA
MQGTADFGARAGLPQRGLFQVSPQRRTPPERTKASTQDSRAHNRSLVLARLYNEGEMSRSELARASKLTAPTISALVAELEQDGLLVEIGPRQEGRVGKPAKLVRIDEDGTNVLVLDLSHSDRFTGAVVNLRGDILDRAEVELGASLGVEAYELVLTLVQKLFALAHRRVLGIGIGSPGIIDDTGVIRHAAHLGWSDLPLAQRLTERFGVAAHLGNDVNLAALAVLHERAKGVQNLMVVTIDHGVGAGLVVGGKLVEGEQFAAGEIGHVTVEEDGDACVCGRRGCLDMLISAAHLRGRLARTDKAQRPAVLAKAGRALGVVLAPIVSVLNLNDVVLTGPPDLIEGTLLEAVIETAQARTLPAVSASLRIRSLAGDTDLTLIGSACMVLSAELGVL